MICRQSAHHNPNTTFDNFHGCRVDFWPSTILQCSNLLKMVQIVIFRWPNSAAISTPFAPTNFVHSNYTRLFVYNQAPSLHPVFILIGNPSKPYRAMPENGATKLSALTRETEHEAKSTYTLVRVLYKRLSQKQFFLFQALYAGLGPCS